MEGVKLLEKAKKLLTAMVEEVEPPIIEKLAVDGFDSIEDKRDAECSGIACLCLRDMITVIDKYIDAIKKHREEAKSEYVWRCDESGGDGWPYDD